MPPPTQPGPGLLLRELLCSFFFCLLLSMVVRGLMGWELRGSVLEFWHGNPCAFMVGDEKLAATRAGDTQSTLGTCTGGCSSGSLTNSVTKHLMGLEQLLLSSSRA